jgi:peptide/nickel transport system substrate-binding protein
MRSRPLSLVATLFVLAACSGKESTPSGGSATGGTMVVAVIGDPVHLLPPLVNDIVGKEVMDLVYDKLAEIGPEMNTIGDKGFTPRLAKSWTWAPDSLSIAFSLDPRARWHDGTPVTAQDIQYSFQLFTDPKLGSPSGPLLAGIDSVQVKDSATAVAWYGKRSPSQFYDFVYQLIPVPQHVYASIPIDQLQTAEGARKIVGSGQFRLMKWEPSVRVEMLADTSNYRGRPKLDRVIYTVVADPNVGMTQVLTQQADFVENFPIDQVKTLDSSTVVRPLVLPGLAYTFAGFNPYAPKSTTRPHPIFSDIRVRRALSMAVDRASMLQNVFGAYGRIGHGPFPMSHALADSTVKLPPYDTTAAAALLDSAGWRMGANNVRMKNGQPLKFSILTPTTSLFRRAYSVLLQDQFRKLGVQTEIESLDNQAFTVRSRQGDYDLLLNSFFTDAGASGFSQNWSTTGIGPTGQNTLRYSNRKVDALLDSAASAFDASKAKAYAKQAFQLVADDVPAIWLYDVTQIAAVHRRLNVGLIRSDGWSVDVGSWSVDPAKRIDRDRIGLATAQK